MKELNLLLLAGLIAVILSWFTPPEKPVVPMSGQITDNISWQIPAHPDRNLGKKFVSVKTSTLWGGEKRQSTRNSEASSDNSWTFYGTVIRTDDIWAVIQYGPDNKIIQARSGDVLPGNFIIEKIQQNCITVKNSDNHKTLTLYYDNK